MGLIKDLCVTLAQIHAKSLVIDIVVADIPPKYGMLLSRSWGEKLQGTLQMDMTFATIPIFRQQRRLYRKTLMKFMVSTQGRPQNYPLYSVHSNLVSFILYNDGDIHNQVINAENEVSKTDLAQTQITKLKISPEPLWSMSFDGSYSKDGAGVGIWVVNTRNNHVEGHSHRLNFHCTNNIAEYEALILSLQLLKRLGAKIISIQGDVKLIIKEIKGECSDKHPRMRALKNVVLAFLESFL